MAEPESNPAPAGTEVFINPDGMAAFVDPATKERYWIPKDKVGDALREGYAPETQESVEAHQRFKHYEESEGKAALTAAARGLTFGLSDVLATKSGFATKQELRGLREANPAISFTGELAGAIGTALIPGGAVARVGTAASKGGAKLAARIAAKRGMAMSQAAKVARGTQGLAVAASEGALYGAGAGITEAALHDNKSWEDVAGKIAKGMGYGAGIGLATGMAGLGLRTAGAKLKARAEQQLSGKPLSDSQRKMAQSSIKQSEARIAELRELGPLTKKGKPRKNFTGEILDEQANIAYRQQQLARGTSRHREMLERELAVKQAVADNWAKVSNKQSIKRVNKLGSQMDYLERQIARYDQGLVAGLVDKGIAKMQAAQGLSYGVVGPTLLLGARLAASPLKGAARMAGSFADRYGAQLSSAIARTIRAETPRVLTAAEYRKLGEEFEKNPPQVLAEKVSLLAPPHAPQEVVAQTAAKVGAIASFIQREMPQPPPGEAERSKVIGRAWAPTYQERLKFGRKLRAAVDPESVVRDFAAKKLTSEAVDTADELHPEVMRQVRAVVTDEARRAEERKERYDKHTGEQLATLLKDDRYRPRMIDPQVVQILQGSFTDTQGKKTGGGSANLSLVGNTQSELARIKRA